MYITTVVNVGAPDDLSGRIDSAPIASLLQKTIDAGEAPAIAVSVFTPNAKLVLLHGFRDMESRSTVAPDDFFHLGSCTKAITAFVAARLVDQGLLSWEKTLADLFPDWLATTNEVYHQKTLTEFLSHRAGVQPFTGGEEFIKTPAHIMEMQNPAARQEFSRWVLTLDPATDPESPIVYSNAGYSVAASMMEKASQRSWENLVQQEFADLFEIDILFGHPHLTQEQQPRGHIIPKEWEVGNSEVLTPLPDSLGYTIFLSEPAGDVSASISAYAKYLQEILLGLNGQGRFLKPATYQHLFFAREDYALGWGNPKINGLQILNHDGSDGTFYCNTNLIKEANYGLAILANSGTEKTINAVYAIHDWIHANIK